MKTGHFSCFYQVICCFLLVVYLSILNASPLRIVTKKIAGNCIVHNRWVAAQSIFYHLYNQVSYMSLDEISPLTFSIGNTMKRISVIVSSIIIFHTPVQPVNALGAAIAIFGTFLYSQVFSCHHFMYSCLKDPLQRGNVFRVFCVNAHYRTVRRRTRTSKVVNPSIKSSHCCMKALLFPGV